jgi:hypothetical protein
VGLVRCSNWNCETPKEAVEAYRWWIEHHLPEKLEAKIAPLRGKNLACWCPPGQPCHADVLLQVANEPKRVARTDKERAQELMNAADALDREADRMEGTCWAGDMSPSMARRMEANEKREHAQLLLLRSKFMRKK